MSKDNNEHLGSSDGSSDGFPVCDDFLIQENKVLQEKYMDRRRGQRHAESYAMPKRIDATDSEQIEYRQV